MLTDEEKREIEAELKNYPSREAGCVDAMKIVQKHRRWVSDEALADLAPVLGMTKDELDAVATFYPFIFRRPVGRHVIFVCDSVTCWVLGYEAVLERLKTELGIMIGGTTHDSRFTLLPVSCLGACDRAPAIMVDRDLYGNVEPDTVMQVLEGYD
jgi:NADH-quinone oxidoreductase subunit E